VEGGVKSVYGLRLRKNGWNKVRIIVIKNECQTDMIPTNLIGLG